MSKNHTELLEKSPKKLTDEEYLYLAARDLLPKELRPTTEEEQRELQRRLNPNQAGVSAVNTGTVNTLGVTQEEFDRFLAWQAAQEEAQAPAFTLEGQSQSESKYMSMNKDELINLLAERDLPIDGRKVELAARLEDDDAANEANQA